MILPTKSLYSQILADLKQRRLRILYLNYQWYPIFNLVQNLLIQYIRRNEEYHHIPLIIYWQISLQRNDYLSMKVLRVQLQNSNTEEHLKIGSQSKIEMQDLRAHQRSQMLSSPQILMSLVNSSMTLILFNQGLKNEN